MRRLLIFALLVVAVLVTMGAGFNTVGFRTSIHSGPHFPLTPPLIASPSSYLFDDVGENHYFIIIATSPSSGFITFESDNTDVAVVGSTTGIVSTGVATGTANVLVKQASYGQYFNSAQVSIPVAKTFETIIVPNMPRTGLIFEGIQGLWTKSDATHISTWTNQIVGKESAYQDVAVYQPNIATSGALDFNGKHLRIPGSLFQTKTSGAIVIYSEKLGASGYVLGEPTGNGVNIMCPEWARPYAYHPNMVVSAGLWGLTFDSSGYTAFNSNATISYALEGIQFPGDSYTVNVGVFGSWIKYLYFYDHKLSDSEITQIRSAFP